MKNSRCLYFFINTGRLQDDSGDEVLLCTCKSDSVIFVFPAMLTLNKLHVLNKT